MPRCPGPRSRRRSAASLTSSGVPRAAVERRAALRWGAAPWPSGAASKVTQTWRTRPSRTPRARRWQRCQRSCKILPSTGLATLLQVAPRAPRVPLSFSGSPAPCTVGVSQSASRRRGPCHGRRGVGGHDGRPCRPLTPAFLEGPRPRGQVHLGQSGIGIIIVIVIKHRIFAPLIFACRVWHSCRGIRHSCRAYLRAVAFGTRAPNICAYLSSRRVSSRRFMFPTPLSALGNYASSRVQTRSRGDQPWRVKY